MAATRDGSAKGFLHKAGKITSKYAGRAHEKMLQKMGKAEGTKDDLFQQYSTNLNMQHTTAVKLHKETHIYFDKTKAWLAASRSLFKVAGECYEQEWGEKEKFEQIEEQSALLGEDLQDTIRVQVAEQLDHYLIRFADMKTLIGKRERKLLDYDRARRELEALKSKEKLNDLKLQKAEEQHEFTKKNFEDVDAKLREDLPAFYDSRINVYTSALQNFSQAHSRFFEESIKLVGIVSEMMQKLQSEASKHSILRPETVSISNSNESESGSISDKGTSAHEVPAEVTPSEETEVTLNEDEQPKDENATIATPGVTLAADDTGSLKKTPPKKPTRPEGSAPTSESLRKPPSLTDIVDNIKPPKTPPSGRKDTVPSSVEQSNSTEKVEVIDEDEGEEDITTEAPKEEEKEIVTEKKETGSPPPDIVITPTEDEVPLSVPTDEEKKPEVESVVEENKTLSDPEETLQEVSASGDTMEAETGQKVQEEPSDIDQQEEPAEAPTELQPQSSDDVKANTEEKKVQEEEILKANENASQKLPEGKEVEPAEEPKPSDQDRQADPPTLSSDPPTVTASKSKENYFMEKFGVKILFKVEVIHPYNEQGDDDELVLQKGDIVYVIPFDDPEEQDEGWQMGIQERTELKGVFPENFTRRIP